jgi:hypothetical protein
MSIYCPVRIYFIMFMDQLIKLNSRLICCPWLIFVIFWENYRFHKIKKKSKGTYNAKYVVLRSKSKEWSVQSRGFESRSSQTKDYKIGICCFSAKHAALKRKSKDWLARNQNNVSEWSDMSTRGLLFQWTSTINIQLSVLVYYKADIIIISSKRNLFSP